MRPPFKRGFLYLFGACLLYTSFLVAAPWSEGYLTRYGNFLLSRGELALKLHLLLFILPAAIVLSLALAEWQPARLVVAFDKLATRRPNRSPAIFGALLVFGLVMLVRVYVLMGSVVTDDENVYHFQARLLASGRLYAPSLPETVRSFFDNQFIVNNGRWFGLYFLGHSAVLALALKVGLFESIGAIEAGLVLLLAVGIAQRIFNRRVAVLTGALLCVSPFFVFVSATHLSQPSSLLFLTSFVYAILRIEASARAGQWWVLAATALVCAIFTRPQTGVLLALPFLVRITWLCVTAALRPGWVGPAFALIILVGGAAGFLGVNHTLTGSAFRTGYQAYMAQGIPWLFPFGPFYTIREISQNLAQLNFWLLGWPLSLAFIVFFERTPSAWALAAIPTIALLWYGLVAVPTVAAVGPVYYAEAIVPLLIMTASGIERVITFLRTRIGNAVPTRAVIATPVVGTLACLFAFAPFEIASLRLMAEVTRAPYDLVAQQRLSHALVFVQSLPARHLSPGSWAYFHRNNSPDLDDPVLFVRDLGPERNMVLMHYLPDRTPYWMGMRDGRLALYPIGRGDPAAPR